MILNPLPLVLPYITHLSLVCAPLHRELPKVPTDIPRSKLIHLQGYCQSFTHSKKGHLKSLKLQVGPDQLTLKIPKLLGHSFSHQFVFGQPLRIIAKRGKKSLKAMFILPVEHLEGDVSPTALGSKPNASSKGLKMDKPVQKPQTQPVFPQTRLISPLASPQVSPLVQKPSSSSHPLALVAAAPAIAPVPPPRSLPRAKPVQIQVCSKGNCKKRGSCQLAQELQFNIKQAGLQKQIQVEMTGCLKQCQQAPNLKLKPQGQVLSQVQAQDLPQLIRNLSSPSLL